MITDLNAPRNRWKYMTINEYRKPYIKIRPDDNVVSNQKTIKTS